MVHRVAAIHRRIYSEVVDVFENGIDRLPADYSTAENNYGFVLEAMVNRSTYALFMGEGGINKSLKLVDDATKRFVDACLRSVG